MKVGIIGRGKMGKDIQTFFNDNNIQTILIGSSGDYSKLDDCDFSIESTSEDLEIKSKVFSKTKNVFSNTSFLKVAIPQIHFMNPAHKNKVVEVTSDVSIDIINLLEKLGKEVFIVPKIEGLIVNRVLMGGLSEYLKLKEKYGECLDIADLCFKALRYDYDRAIKFIGYDIVKSMNDSYKEVLRG